MTSDVTFIVLDLDGGEMLSKCVAAIAAQTVGPSRLIVFDNGSAVPVAQRLQAPPGIDMRIMRSEVNLGFAGGINAAMEGVESPFVAWINNDAILEPAWLGRVRSPFDYEPRLAAAQTMILREDGLFDGAGIDISSGTFRQLLHGGAVWSFSEIAAAWGISATAAIYRTSALRSVGNGGEILLPLLFAYYEDVELSARLRRTGWSVRVLPVALVTHRGSATGGKIGRRRAHLLVRNRYLVHRLHPEAGSLKALLAEDFRGLTRDLLGLQLSGAARRIVAMGEGLTRGL